MNKSLGSWVLAVILPAMMLGAPSCLSNLFDPSIKVEDVVMTLDGQGGVYVLYQAHIGSNYGTYLQRIDAGGSRQWGEQGVLLDTSRYNEIYFIKLICDPVGNAVALVNLQHTGPNELYKISPEGKVLWKQAIADYDDGANPHATENMPATDNNGIVYVSTHGSLQKIDLEGNQLWGATGIPLLGPYPDLYYDEQGSLFLVYYPVIRDTPVPGQLLNGQVKIQRLDASGRQTWVASLGINFTDVILYPNLTCVSDNLGGVSILWVEDGLTRDTHGMDIPDVKITHIDSEGKINWEKKNILGDNFLFPEPKLICAMNGVLLVQTTDFDASKIAKINVNGSVDWAVDWEFEYSSETASVPDGSGGTFLIINARVSLVNGQILPANHPLLVWRIDSAGHWVYPGGFFSVTTGEHRDITMGRFLVLPDSQGGLILAWDTSEHSFLNEHSFVQRVGPNGEALWGGQGIQLDDWDR